MNPRRALGLACLALLALSLAAAIRPGELLGRIRETPEPGFAFDPRFRAFLEGVERATPPSATVAVLAPENERYLRLAAYELSPRRVVGRELAGEAPYLAVYRRKAQPLPAAAESLPGGFLLKR